MKQARTSRQAKHRLYLKVKWAGLDGQVKQASWDNHQRRTMSAGQAKQGEPVEQVRQTGPSRHMMPGQSLPGNH